MRVATIAILLSLGASVAAAQAPSTADQITAAVLPLPEALRAGAGVRGFDAARRPVELRKSANGVTCLGDRPGDTLFDARCYDNRLVAAILRFRDLARAGGADAADSALDAELARDTLAALPPASAGYRMLGPVSAYNPATHTWTAAMARWQSVHLPMATATDLHVPTERDGPEPYMMASGTWWAHLMVEPPSPAPADTSATRLGVISFPTSGSPAAQPHFIRGVLLMHSFEYPDAAAEFRKAEALDPGFAMAYWGEAMTFTHPVWNEQNRDSARAVLARLAPTPEARAAKAGSARERAWLAAVETLYGDGGKARRDTLYSAAMETLAQQYPEDDEAQTFYALSLLGLNQGVRDVPAYMRAGAIALRVLRRNPRHPGAAHYAIHAFDDPQHAVLGLDAARAYATIAPGASHAQHMTTHIFLARGMWPEVVAQNRIALGPTRQFYFANHYSYWLHYGLVQQGKFAEAAALLDTLHQNQKPGAGPGTRGQLALARAQQVFTSERWDDPSLQWPIAMDSVWDAGRAADIFTLGYAALMRGDRAAATSAEAALKGIKAGSGLDTLPALIASELSAAIMRARGDTVHAEASLQAVAEASAALPAVFGPPDMVKPPYELLGEWLVADGQRARAHAAFQRALELMPGRWLSERGLRASQ